MGRQGVPIKDGNLDLYLAGFTLDQQRQAGDSSGRATSVGERLNRQTTRTTGSGLLEGCQKDADIGSLGSLRARDDDY